MKEGVHKTLRDQETGLIVGMNQNQNQIWRNLLSAQFCKATTNVGTKYNVGFRNQRRTKTECYA